MSYKVGDLIRNNDDYGYIESAVIINITDKLITFKLSETSILDDIDQDFYNKCSIYEFEQALREGKISVINITNPKIINWKERIR